MIDFSALAERFNDHLALAQRTEGIPEPTAFALATVGPGNRPSVRIVLLKVVDSRGFVFYTNTLSRKGRELAGIDRAAMCFWWGALARQIRIEGRVEPVSQEEADDMCRRLASEEGIFAGISAAGACWVAQQVAQQVDNATIVFVVCDRGDRYLSTGVFPA